MKKHTFSETKTPEISHPILSCTL